MKFKFKSFTGDKKEQSGTSVSLTNEQPMCQCVSAGHARSEELELLAGGHRDGLSLLNGWRYDIFGRDALALVEGRTGFSVQAGRMVMSDLDVRDTADA